MNKELLQHFGFRYGKNGAHSARTMMFSEIELLLDIMKIKSNKDDYRLSIVDRNVLNKQTIKSRELTYRHLVELYGLDNNINIFRNFRLSWENDKKARPHLALTISMARDPLLRTSQNLILGKNIDEQVNRVDVEEILSKDNRFSTASVKSIAQNINGTWTRAGFLHGKIKKYRVKPEITPSNVVYCLYLAYLEGARAQMLFQSSWARLLDCSLDTIIDYLRIANQRGIVIFRYSGGIFDIKFPNFFTEDEATLIHE